MGRKAINWSTFSNLVFIILSITAIGSYLFVALSRIGSPFALEWLEANTFIHVVRVLRAQPLYVAPSFDFIPMIYTPLYYYLAAPFALATGQIMLAMRLVSLLSSISIFACIYAICRTRELSRPASLLGVGLFAATFGVTGFWLDIARVDTLFVALLVGAFLSASIRSRRDTLLGIVSGMLLLLSFMAKQQAVLMFPFLVLLLVVRRQRRRAYILAAVFLAGLALCVIGLNIYSDGWFWFYAYELPSSVPLATPMFVDFWTIYFLPAFGFILLLIAAVGMLAWRIQRSQGFLLLLATFVLPTVLMSYISLVNYFGYLNALLPSAVALAICGAEAVSMLLSTNIRGVIGTGCKVLTMLFVVLQFWTLRYDVMGQIPDADHERLGYMILDSLRQAPAPMFAPTAPYLLYMVGQPIHFQASSYGDLDAGSRHNPYIKEVMDEYGLGFPQFFANRHFHTALLPDRDWYDALFSGELGYQCEPLAYRDEQFGPMTGAPAIIDRLCRDR